MPYDAKRYYHLGRSLSMTQKRWPEGVSTHIAETANALHVSENYLWRAMGYYKLYCRALGFGVNVFQLGPRQLDELRGQIDWDPKTGEVGTGTDVRMGKAAARARIRRLLGDLNAMDK